MNSRQLVLMRSIAKFMNYEYGGRPLGLSFVKYLTPGGYNQAGGDHPMEGTEPMTQDQMM